MSVFVLVATPTVAFGDLIRHSLEEAGRYQVQLVYTAYEARAALQDGCRGIAILDSDLPGGQIGELAAYFNEHFPGMRLVLIPPENNPQHPSLAGAKCAAFLRKPFYLPDLIELMAALSQELEDRPGLPARAGGMEWIHPEVLTRLVSTTSALSAVLIRREGPSILYGALPESALEGLVGLAGRFWQRTERTDLVRFVRLPHSDLDTLVYLSAVAQDGDVVLGAIYPGATPLSKVRSQMVPVIQALREMSLAGKVPPPSSREARLTDAAALKPSGEVQAAKQAPLHEEAPGDEEGNQSEEIRLFDLAELLGAIPDPDPGASRTRFPDQGDNGLRSEPVQEAAAGILSSEAAPAEAGLRPAVQTEARAPAAALPENKPLGEGSSETEELVENEEGLSPLTGLDPLESVSGGISFLNYTCVLIPRLTQHALTGELCERLAAWVRQLCLAFGWRLEKIDLHPEYLQWTVQVAPSISPGNVVKIVRQRTSERIFNHFDTLRQENPSGDFWAAGYLILSGSQPPSPRLLRDTIAQIRRRQGIERGAGENLSA